MGNPEREDREALRAWIGGRPQREAARELGSSQAFLSQFLAGRRELSAQRIVEWSDATGIDVEVFALAPVRELMPAA